MHVSFIVLEQAYMVFQLRNRDMPHVEVFTQILQSFGFNSHLWVLERHDLLKHRASELGFDLRGDH